jgi:hypothetical protein
MNVYQGTVEMLLNDDAFVKEFLLRVRTKDFSRLINEGIYAKLFIENSYRREIQNLSPVTTGSEEKDHNREPILLNADF